MKFVAAMIPLIAFWFIFFQTRKIWKTLENSGLSDEFDGNRSTQHLSDKIYRNFEFFIKIFLALIGGYGWIKFNYADTHPETVRYIIYAIGVIGMLTMIVLVLSVASIQGWKFLRWRRVKWELIWTWQEIYMMVAMFILASCLWWSAFFFG